MKSLILKLPILKIIIIPSVYKITIITNVFELTISVIIEKVGEKTLNSEYVRLKGFSRGPFFKCLMIRILKISI